MSFQSSMQRYFLAHRAFSRYSPSMPHTNDTVCLTVAVFLVQNEKVLLANHPKYNAWLGLGGHIDPGEDTDQALFKEIWEEAGLTKDQVTILGSKPFIPGSQNTSLFTPLYIDRHKANDRDHVALIYFGTVLEGAEPRVSEEHLELRWFSETDLNANFLKPDTAWYAKEALRLLSSPLP